MALKATNITSWLEENRSSFAPPVCNKLMHGAGQMKIMFVGGPNQRKDYHIEEGEEFFTMIQGDMVLKVIEQGRHKDIPIKQGEVFVLPSRIPHSPQRTEGTIGFVIERERLSHEMDGLRYYVEDSTEPLWEEWFHCTDLGTQLGPVIKRYFASEEHKTGRPPPGKVFPSPPVNIDTTTRLDQPFSLKQWLANSDDEIKQNGMKQLFGGGEFKFIVRENGVEDDQHCGEAFLWQLEGDAKVTCNGDHVMMGPQDCVLVPAGARYTVTRTAGSRGVTVTNNKTS